MIPSQLVDFFTAPACRSAETSGSSLLGDLGEWRDGFEAYEDKVFPKIGVPPNHEF